MGSYLIILISEMSHNTNAAIIGITVAGLALFVLVALVVVRRKMKKGSDASSYIEVEIPEVKQDENCPDTKIETKEDGTTHKFLVFKQSQGKVISMVLMNCLSDVCKTCAL